MSTRRDRALRRLQAKKKRQQDEKTAAGLAALAERHKEARGAVLDKPLGEYQRALLYRLRTDGINSVFMATESINTLKVFAVYVCGVLHDWWRRVHDAHADDARVLRSGAIVALRSASEAARFVHFVALIRERFVAPVSVAAADARRVPTPLEIVRCAPFSVCYGVAGHKRARFELRCLFLTTDAEPSARHWQPTCVADWRDDATESVLVNMVPAENVARLDELATHAHVSGANFIMAQPHRAVTAQKSRDALATELSRQKRVEAAARALRLDPVELYRARHHHRRHRAQASVEGGQEE